MRTSRTAVARGSGPPQPGREPRGQDLGRGDLLPDRDRCAPGWRRDAGAALRRVQAEEEMSRVLAEGGGRRNWLVPKAQVPGAALGGCSSLP